MDKKLEIILAVVILIIVVIVGLLIGGRVIAPKISKTPTPATKGETVEMREYAFWPRTIKVKKGGQITWTNKDSVAHTVTGEGFTSGTIEVGKTYNHTFDKAGTIDYKCSIHPTIMQGQIIVEE